MCGSLNYWLHLGGSSPCGVKVVLVTRHKGEVQRALFIQDYSNATHIFLLEVQPHFMRRIISLQSRLEIVGRHAGYAGRL